MSDSSSICREGALYINPYLVMMGDRTLSSKITTRLAQTVLLALIIICALGVVYNYSANMVAYSALLGGSGYCIIKLGAGRLSERRVDWGSSAIVAILLIGLGVLGITSVLSELHLCYLLMGSIALSVLATLSMVIHARRMFTAHHWYDWHHSPDATLQGLRL